MDQYDGKTYDFFFADDGKLQYGLQTYNGRKYYFDGSFGRRVNGWMTIDGSDYYFAPYAMTNTVMKLVRGGVESYYQFDAEGRATSADASAMNFVQRCFQKVLNRASGSAELTEWVDQLRSGRMNAATVIDSIMEGEEFKARGLSTADQVEILYNIMLDRESDPEGKKGWKDYLDAGGTIKNVINGFSGSEEFIQLCYEYGLTAGEVIVKPQDENKNITDFVERCYWSMGRTSDEGGLNYWCDKLLSKSYSPRQVAAGFIFSDEMKAKSLDDQITTMYQLYLNRTPDPGGFEYWKNRVLNEPGFTLEHLNNGFADSVEFAGIVKYFGLQ